MDDEPAPVREWLPVVADVLGAKPPHHVPVRLAKMLAGDVAVILGTEARGASNAKAKRELCSDTRAGDKASRRCTRSRPRRPRI